VPCHDDSGNIVFRDHTLTGYHIDRDENLNEAAHIFSKKELDYQIFTLSRYLLWRQKQITEGKGSGVDKAS
jgi:hypothetical protein